MVKTPCWWHVVLSYTRGAAMFNIIKVMVSALAWTLSFVLFSLLNSVLTSHEPWCCPLLCTLAHVAFCFLATQAVCTGRHRWRLMFHLLVLNGVKTRTVPVEFWSAPSLLHQWLWARPRLTKPQLVIPSLIMYTHFFLQCIEGGLLLQFLKVPFEHIPSLMQLLYCNICGSVKQFGAW